MDVRTKMLVFPAFRGLDRSFSPQMSAGKSAWTSAGYPAPKLTLWADFSFLSNVLWSRAPTRGSSSADGPSRQSLVFSEHDQLSQAIPQFHVERSLHEWTPIARIARSELQDNERKLEAPRRVPKQTLFKAQKTCHFDTPFVWIPLWVLQKRHPNGHQNRRVPKCPVY